MSAPGNLEICVQPLAQQYYVNNNITKTYKLYNIINRIIDNGKEELLIRIQIINSIHTQVIYIQFFATIYYKEII